MTKKINRYGKLSLEAKKKVRAQRAQGISPSHEQYDMSKNYSRIREIKITYSTEVETECDIYDIAYIDTVKTISYEPRLPGPRVVWQGGTYYTLGNKIDTFEGKSLETCLVIIKESIHNCEYINGIKHYRNCKQFNSKWNIYLYKDQKLYLMSSYQHPEIARNSYSFSDEVCTNQLYINIFNEELERVLAQKEKEEQKPEEPKQKRKSIFERNKQNR